MTTMKKTYQTPSIKVVKIDSTDIICTSPTNMRLFNSNDDVDPDADYDFEAL